MCAGGCSSRVAAVAVALALLSLLDSHVYGRLLWGNEIEGGLVWFVWLGLAWLGHFRFRDQDQDRGDWREREEKRGRYA